MTAEIAILNKSAVALATDSAVTISSGAEALKIFESADKLFELSKRQPIGIMVYNGMQFMGVPLETIVKNFRRACPDYETVADAGNAFLQSLYQYVDNAPEEEVARSIRSVVGTLANEISERIEQNALKAISEWQENGNQDRDAAFTYIQKVIEDVIEDYRSTVDGFDPAECIERVNPDAHAERYDQLITDAVKQSISGFSESHLNEIAIICKAFLASNILSPQKTGIIFSGFGEKEIFPTLISFEIDGIHQGGIRFSETSRCDIDRGGRKAYVRPFAQKDMVERFLHGLDDSLKEDIGRYCEETLSELLTGLVGSVQFQEQNEADELTSKSEAAQAAFLDGLMNRAFREFETRSRRQIEDMVEFMPKPELAKMAEALIDLTSIKRKVTQGLETVGGPVDVAVISKNDGFVWVKRKHYFPTELNAGFRARSQVAQLIGGNE